MNALAVCALIYAGALVACVLAIIVGQIPERRRSAWRSKVLDGACPAGFRPPLGNHDQNWRCAGCPNRTDLR
jgi:hypothetical protein